MSRRSRRIKIECLDWNWSVGYLSFDNFCDRKAAHILSAFASDPALVLAHLECDEKSNEIPAVQALLRQLGLEQAVLTVDAMHCQKKPLRRPQQLAPC